MPCKNTLSATYFVKEFILFFHNVFMKYMFVLNQGVETEHEEEILIF